MAIIKFLPAAANLAALVILSQQFCFAKKLPTAREATPLR